MCLLPIALTSVWTNIPASHYRGDQPSSQAWQLTNLSPGDDLNCVCPLTHVDSRYCGLPLGWRLIQFSARGQSFYINLMSTRYTLMLLSSSSSQFWICLLSILQYYIKKTSLLFSVLFVSISSSPLSTHAEVHAHSLQHILWFLLSW